jgi:Predicted signal-transduction protein containing cAMP-binding and CBS domains
MVERIASILLAKGAALHSVSPDAAVYEAVVIMAARRVGAVLVIEQDSLVGIISAKDYGSRVVLQGKNGKDVLVRDVMTSPVLTVGPETKVVDGMQIMTTNKIRHLPVVENGELMGVVTLGELVRAVLADQEHKIDHLMRYVGHK